MKRTRSSSSAWEKNGCWPGEVDLPPVALKFRTALRVTPASRQMMATEAPCTTRAAIMLR